MFKPSTCTLTLLLFCSLFTACTTGQKALERGNYHKAVLQSVDRLRSDSDNIKAMSVLEVAYPQAERAELDTLSWAEKSQDSYRWETIRGAYIRLNQIAEAVRSSGAAQSIIPNPQTYYAEVEEASQKAAQVRIDKGDALMRFGNREKARQAVKQYAKAEALLPGYGDADLKLEDAREAATLHVLVAPLQTAVHDAPTQELEYQLENYFDNFRPNEFIAFHLGNYRSSEPEQTIQLKLAYFDIGRAQYQSGQKTYTKENVVVGKTNTNPPVEVLGNVSATAKIFQKTIPISVGLRFEIVDNQTGRILKKGLLNHEDTWVDQWASYNGDSRAIPDEIKKLVEHSEQPTPNSRELLNAYNEVLIKKLHAELQRFYQRY